MDDFDTLIFMHLGKTAGGSFNDAIFFRLPAEQRFHASRGRTNGLGLHLRQDIEAAYAQEWAGRRNEPRLISGHLQFGIHKMLRGRWRYISLIRHPVDRIISQYYYLKQIDLSNTPIYELMENISLADYATSRLSPDLHNGQTRALSGIDKLGAATGSDIEFPDVCEADFDMALSNIDKHFLFIAPHTEVDVVIRMISDIYGIAPESLPKQPANVTVNRPAVEDIDESVKAAILRNNLFDFRLYQHTQKSFAAFRARIL